MRGIVGAGSGGVKAICSEAHLALAKWARRDSTSAAKADLLVLYGPTLLVAIGFDPRYDRHSIQPPELGKDQFEALVDTGATYNCIDNILAATLRLPMVDRAEIAGIAGRHAVNVYLAQVHVAALNMTIHGSFAGVDLKAGGQMHQALIDRIFLRHFTMNYEGRSGSVILSND